MLSVQIPTVTEISVYNLRFQMAFCDQVTVDLKIMKILSQRTGLDKENWEQNLTVFFFFFSPVKEARESDATKDIGRFQDLSG